MDIDVVSRRLELPCDALSRLLEEDRCSTWFRLDIVWYELPEETGVEYKPGINDVFGHGTLEHTGNCHPFDSLR